ncbi:hypothetical protein NKH18_49175 [Streptomyces sp. M10(2022)]
MVAAAGVFGQVAQRHQAGCGLGADQGAQGGPAMASGNRSPPSILAAPRWMPPACSASAGQVPKASQRTITVVAGRHFSCGGTRTSTIGSSGRRGAVRLRRWMPPRTTQARRSNGWSSCTLVSFV